MSLRVGPTAQLSLTESVLLPSTHTGMVIVSLTHVQHPLDSIRPGPSEYVSGKSFLIPTTPDLRMEFSLPLSLSSRLKDCCEGASCGRIDEARREDSAHAASCPMVQLKDQFSRNQHTEKRAGEGRGDAHRRRRTAKTLTSGL